MDQKFISGLGNIYSDEVLFHAGLRYDRLSDTLSSQEVRRLYRAIQEVLQEAIKLRGTTLEDEAYVDLFGKPGEYAERAQGVRPRGPAVPPVPHADPEREALPAQLLLLSAVPELNRCRWPPRVCRSAEHGSDEIGAGVAHPDDRTVAVARVPGRRRGCRPPAPGSSSRASARRGRSRPRSSRWRVPHTTRRSTPCARSSSSSSVVDVSPLRGSRTLKPE